MDSSPIAHNPLNSKRLLVCLVLVAVLIPLGSYLIGRAGRPAAKEVETFLAGSESAVVSFFRLDPKSNLLPPGERPGASFHGWRILREVPLEAPIVQEVRSILTRPVSYGGQSPRCFQPGMGLKFKSPSRTLDFVLCLDCRHSHGYDDHAPHPDQPVKVWALSSRGADDLMRIYKRYADSRN